MKRMSSIKSKIRKPILLLLVIFTIVTLLLFNLIIRVYLERNARNELKTVANTMQVVAKRELAGNLRNLSKSKLDNAFLKLYKALVASRFAVNTEMLLFSKQQELLYPNGETEGFVTSALIEKISKRLPGMQKKRIYTIRLGAEKYLVLPTILTNTEGAQPTFVFITHLNDTISIIGIVNLILICIMFLGAALAAITANRLSNRIAQPVKELCSLTEKIGKGEFALPAQSGESSDITEINTLYQSIGEMSMKLEAYDKSQKTFLQNASHELKTPLMSIQGYAEGIAKGVLPDVKNAAEVIGNESMRLNTLVEELLTLSRIESQTYTKELVPINLCNILKEYVQRLGGFAARQQRQLLLELPDSPVHVKADDSLLSQAVMNIASNCLRYAKSTVKVQLITIGASSSAIIKITDDGSGIPEADLPHVFERFYKGKGGNFGLGLAIAKSAVEFMGGSVHAYNGNRGAVFEILLRYER